MDTTAKTSISLTDDQEAFARSLVDSGQYPSLSAVLQRGLEMLRRDCELRDAELQALQALIDQRRAGAFVDVEVATRPFPSALPPTEAENADWRALPRDEQIARYREAVLALDAGRVSNASMSEVLTEARQRVAARRA